MQRVNAKILRLVSLAQDDSLWPKILEDGQPAFFLGLCVLGRGAEGPADALNVPQLAAQEAAQPVPVGKFVGDEVRPRQEVQQVAGQQQLN